MGVAQPPNPTSHQRLVPCLSPYQIIRGLISGVATDQYSRAIKQSVKKVGVNTLAATFYRQSTPAKAARATVGSNGETYEANNRRQLLVPFKSSCREVGTHHHPVCDALMLDIASTQTGFSIGQVLSLTFRMIGRIYGRLVVLLVLTYGAQYALGQLSLTVIHATGPWLFVRSIAGGNLISLLPQGFLAGSISTLVFADLNRRPASLGALLRAGLRLLLPIAVLNLVFGLAIGLGLVLLIVPGLILLVRWFVVAPARAIEGPGIRNAFAHSAALTQGYRWKIFVLAVIFLLGSVLVSGGGTYITMNWGRALAGLHLAALPTLLLSAVVGGFKAVATAVTYVEVRRVKQGGLAGELAAVFE